MVKRVSVERALLDLLREYGITVDDLVAAMEQEGIDVYGELLKRVTPRTREAEAYIYSLPRRLASLLLFTLQALYIINISGLYKDYLLDPPRWRIMVGDKATLLGVKMLVEKIRLIA